MDGLRLLGMGRIFTLKKTMYKIGITTYDNDAMLFETHIGTKGGDLAYSAWGNTEQESTHKAEFLISVLNIGYELS